jgi:hypothetical protein
VQVRWTGRAAAAVRLLFPCHAGDSGFVIHCVVSAFPNETPRVPVRSLAAHATARLAAVETSSLLDLIQWPAMLASVLAAWLVASRKARRRNIGFWVFIVSNVLWTVWGVHTNAYALIVLQVTLAIMNIRGLRKTEQLERKGKNSE